MNRMSRLSRRSLAGVALLRGRHVACLGSGATYSNANGEDAAFDQILESVCTDKAS